MPPLRPLLPVRPLLPLLEVLGVEKRFGGLAALAGVSLAV